MKHYEPILAEAKSLLVISEGELSHFKQINSNAVVVPSIIELPKKQEETKPIVLFHGNLSVEENIDAVNWILDQVVSALPEINFVIAGKNPSSELVQKCLVKKVELAASPDTKTMTDLIQTARIHLLWSNNSSGLKLKFLQAMSSSGHVICSPEFLEGTIVKKGIHLFTTAEEAISLIEQKIDESLSEKEFTERQELLHTNSGVQKLRELFVD